eukprot:GILJ01016205.1.p2 GENE.GILJ01016205.1~~GILJ01016205.1.p2  ORF type:complete len:224 (-),score=35.74 GILJ01016205.1:167-838(-)
MMVRSRIEWKKEQLDAAVEYMDRAVSWFKLLNDNVGFISASIECFQMKREMFCRTCTMNQNQISSISTDDDMHQNELKCQGIKQAYISLKELNRLLVEGLHERQLAVLHLELYVSHHLLSRYISPSYIYWNNELNSQQDLDTYRISITDRFDKYLFAEEIKTAERELGCRLIELCTVTATPVSTTVTVPVSSVECDPRLDPMPLLVELGLFNSDSDSACELVD